MLIELLTRQQVCILNICFSRSGEFQCRCLECCNDSGDRSIRCWSSDIAALSNDFTCKIPPETRKMLAFMIASKGNIGGGMVYAKIVFCIAIFIGRNCF